MEKEIFLRKRRNPDILFRYNTTSLQKGIQKRISEFTGDLAKKALLPQNIVCDPLHTVEKQLPEHGRRYLLQHLLVKRGALEFTKFLKNLFSFSFMTFSFL